ncbi:hypothetical protein MMC08_006612 [Hypocenomyce scalaris]|nr:hypothetical protein [Hypocenomyce scalaris]
MATETITLPKAPTTLYYYLELKDGGVVQTYPGTAFEKRREHVPHPIHIHDMRPARSEFTIDKAGFELVNHVSKEKDFTDEDRVKDIYYPEIVDLVKKVQVTPQKLFARG